MRKTSIISLCTRRLKIKTSVLNLTLKSAAAVMMLFFSLGVKAEIVGDTVILNDYEDHTWTYYAGVPAEADGGSYNTNYLGKLYSPNPRNVKITYNANGGEVSIDESQKIFVYYTTLEEGTTVGQYPYTVISNPFSKRPTGMGFGGWRIVSGGEYIQGYNNNQVLPLDQEITFVNLPYPEVNCTSAEIVFEATWVTLNNVTTITNRNDYVTYSVSGGTYETNILIIQCNHRSGRTITCNSPVTITMVEPDGSADYRNIYTMSTTTITPVAGSANTTKIEFAEWNPGGNINLRGRNFTFGRGMVMGGTLRRLYGTSSNESVDQILKVESGRFQDFYNFGTSLSSGRLTKQWVTFGCDYDRATSNNNNLEFTNALYIAQSIDVRASSGQEVCRVYSKSGKFVTSQQVGSGDADQSYYFGFSNREGDEGYKYLEIQGGEWLNIAGGMGTYNNPTDPCTIIRMKGGLVKGSIYGAAQFANAAGARIFVFTGGTVNGWIAGGANGTQDTRGELNGPSYVYVGGNTQVNSNGSTTPINRAVGGNVFGAGCGYSGTSSSGEVTLGTNVVVADNAYVERGVYGGGSYGFCRTTQTANIYITGGRVGGVSGGVSGTSYSSSIIGGVFGGACQNRGGSVNIRMTGGEVSAGGIYGGSNYTGTLSGSVNINVHGGQVGTTAQTANIHGGGYGVETIISGNVDVTLGANGQTLGGVTVYGDVYGGSALGEVNGTSGTNTLHTYVTLNKGVIYGSLYGGGLGNATTEADVNGPVAVKVYGGSVMETTAQGSGSVYGANNINGKPQRTVTVDIYGTDAAPSESTYAINAVYGGGNRADYTYSTPLVTVHNCTASIGSVYGGGNAASVPGTNVTVNGGTIGNVFGGGNGLLSAANVTGNALTKIYGGTIDNVFGGSNTNGAIGGTVTVNVNDAAENSCALLAGNIYGGGNMAPYSNSGNYPQVNITSGTIEGNVYGGGLGQTAAVTANPRVNLTGGIIGGDVFGGGDAAPVTGSPIVSAVTGSSGTRLFGGGKGATATVTGNTTVTVSGGTFTDIFGGGDAALVTGNTTLTLSGGTMDGAVYGGGNNAGVNGNTGITISNGTISDGVYGGCNVTGTIGGNVNLMLTGGTIGTAGSKSYIHGGGFGKNTTVSGNVDLYVGTSGQTTPGVTIYGDVYGGSALGSVNTGTSNTTKVYLYKGKIYGDAYGGGLGDSETAALVNGNVEVLLNGAAFGISYTGEGDDRIPVSGRIFGCNNINGTPKGTVKVTVLATTPIGGGAHTLGTYEVQGVYGGGNLAAYDPTNSNTPTYVEVDGCDDVSIEYVYGGGNAAPVPATEVMIEGAFEIDYVFGGGNGKDKVGGMENPGADVGLKSGGISYGTGNKIGTTLVTVLGGTIHNVFGGSNTKGDIPKSADVVLGDENLTLCALNVDNVYGAGNEAYMTGTSEITLNCIEGVDEIYGGSKKADISGDVNLNIVGGTFSKIFGGNDESGAILGSITVTIQESGCLPIKIGELYGGGNRAPYSVYGYEVDEFGKVLKDAYGKPVLKTSGTKLYNDPVLNIVSATEIGSVFGGGLGSTAVIHGSPEININMVEGSVNGHYDYIEGFSQPGNELYDPNHADYIGPVLELGKIGNVYGGGNEAAVYGNTTVNVATETGKSAYIINNVYGGGNQANVSGTTKVTIGE